MKKGKNINFNMVMNKAIDLKNNIEMEKNKTVALILEKICNECVITEDFLKSITIEDINKAKEAIGSADPLVIEMQMNTFLETIIKKTKCQKTTDTKDFF